MKYIFVTDGERLAHFVGHRLVHRVPWDRLSASLLNTGRGDALCEFFREVTAINLACRIVVAGTSLLSERKDQSARHISDPTFEKDFRDYLRDRLLLSPPLLDDTFRAAVRAVRASQEQVSATKRARYKRQAHKRHPSCYMCGTTLDFDERDPHGKFTLEHIWPRRFGGNSIEENLLPACGSCNSEKKKDFATWAMTSVQALIIGIAPTENECRSVEGTYRFALHYLAARRLASQRQTNLKDAFLQLKHWQDIRPKDESDLADFFNLVNHRVFAEFQ
ncbi:MAG: HNH endonuclease [Acidobacteria bacterium]|nr:HNH endonuclease [Acidobacteriota bacterium]